MIVKFGPFTHVPMHSHNTHPFPNVVSIFTRRRLVYNWPGSGGSVPSRSSQHLVPGPYISGPEEAGHATVILTVTCRELSGNQPKKKLIAPYYHCYHLGFSRPEKCRGLCPTGVLNCVDLSVGYLTLCICIGFQMSCKFLNLSIRAVESESMTELESVGVNSLGRSQIRIHHDLSDSISGTGWGRNTHPPSKFGLID